MHRAARTAVIPAAGKGTRFLPSTKSTPKELHPLLNKPLIHHCLLELKDAGVEEVIIVSHPEKNTLEKYFSDHQELKSLLLKDGKEELASRLTEIEELPKVRFVHQLEQKGLAHAVMCAESALDGRDFFLLLPDEIFLFDESQYSPCRELKELFNETGKSAISLLQLPEELLSSYGVAKVEEEKGQLKVIDVVEKPAPGTAPSDLILPGRYVFKNQIFDEIRQTPVRNGEVQLTDAIVSLAQKEGVLAHRVSCPRFDGGSVLGFLQANIKAALMDSSISDEISQFIKNL